MKKNMKLLSFVIIFTMLTTIVVPVSADNAASQPTDASYVAPMNVNLFETWLGNWNFDSGNTRTPISSLYGVSGQTIGFEGKIGSPTVENVSGKTGKGKKISNASNTNYLRVVHIPIEQNCFYVITADIKLVSNASDTMDWAATKAGNISISTIGKSSLNVTNDKWTTVRYIFKGGNETVAVGARRDQHIGIYPKNGSDFYLDNWTLTKISDMTVANYVAPTGVNLFDEWCYNWNYDSSSTAISGLYGESNQTLNFAGKNGSPTISDYPDNGGKGKLVENASSSAFLRVNFVPIERDATYILTADVKLKDVASDEMVWTLSANGKNKAQSISTSSLTVSNTEWTTVSCTFKGVENTGKETLTRIDSHIGIYPKTATSYYIDNWTLTKIPALAVSETVVSGNNIIFSFNNNIAITANNFTVSPSTATLNVTGSGNEYVVTLSDYIHSTEYTITTKNITDSYGQNLTKNESVKLLTPANANATLLNSEDLTSGHGLSANRGTLVDGTFTRDEETGTDTNSRVHATHIFVVPGTYIVSAKVRQNAEDTVENATAQVVVGNSGDVSKNVSGEAIDPCIKSEATSNVISINKTTWTEITGIVTITKAKGWNDEDNNLRDDDSLAQTIHAGIASTAHIFDITDVQMRKPATLNLDSAYSAIVKADGSNANLYITGPTSKVYFAAISYNGSKIADIQFKELNITNNKLSVEKLTKGDDYKFFIWDDGFKPLNTTFVSTDF